MHAWVQEFSKNLVRGSTVPLFVAVLIITSDSLGAHFTWFRGGNTWIWEVLFRKTYNSDSEEGALWTSQTPLHPSSSLIYIRVKVGVFQTLERVNKC